SLITTLTHDDEPTGSTLLFTNSSAVNVLENRPRPTVDRSSLASASRRSAPDGGPLLQFSQMNASTREITFAADQQKRPDDCRTVTTQTGALTQDVATFASSVLTARQPSES